MTKKKMTTNKKAAPKRSPGRPPRTSPVVRLTVRLEPGVAAELDRLTIVHGTTKNDIVSTAIMNYSPTTPPDDPPTSDGAKINAIKRILER